MRLRGCVVAFYWAATVMRVDGTSVGARKRTGTHDRCDLAWVGDAVCDAGNNNKECNYDGGDCCSCTCVDTEYNTCGSLYDYDCIDPSVWCKGESRKGDGYYSPDGSYYSALSSTSGSGYPDCLASFIGAGICDAVKFEEGCFFDGGDCCECMCVDARYQCGDGEPGFQCFGAQESGYCLAPTEPPTATAEEQSTAATTTSPFKRCSLVWWRGDCWPAPLHDWIEAVWFTLHPPEA